MLDYFYYEQSNCRGDPGSRFKIPYCLRNELTVGDDGHYFLHHLSRLYFRAYDVWPVLPVSDNWLDKSRSLRVRLTDHAGFHRRRMVMNDVWESL